MANVVRGSNLLTFPDSTIGHRFKKERSAELNRVASNLAAGDTLDSDSVAAGSAILILRGCGYCHKFQADGSRTVTDLLFPDDLISETFLRMTDNLIVALSALRYVVLAAGGDESDSGIRCTKDLLLEASFKRQARLAERITSIGRRDALQRTGHFLLEYAVRAGAPLCDNQLDFECVLTQSIIGDSLGLSSVHVNRVLKELRLRGLVVMKSGRIQINDVTRLCKIAGFDPRYLGD